MSHRKSGFKRTSTFFRFLRVFISGMLGCWLTLLVMPGVLYAQETDYTQYVETFEGDMPLLLAVGHGGWKPVGDQQNGSTDIEDPLLREYFYRVLAVRIYERTGHLPYIVYQQGQRNYVNVDQPVGHTGAYSSTNLEAQGAYFEFHNQLDAMIARLEAAYGADGGVLVNLHTDALPATLGERAWGRIAEIGFGTTITDLGSIDNTLKALYERKGEAALRGEDSVSYQLFHAQEWPTPESVWPAAATSNPKTLAASAADVWHVLPTYVTGWETDAWSTAYYTGGPTIMYHGTNHGGRHANWSNGLDAFQFVVDATGDSGIALAGTPTALDTSFATMLVDDFVDALLHTLEVNYGWTPGGVHNVIVDNGDPGFTTTLTWTVTNGKGYWGTPSIYVDEPGATATWTPDLPVTGTYEVLVRWTKSGARTYDARYTVNHRNESRTFVIDQTGPQDAKWVSLGEFPFDAGTGGNVVLTCTGTGLSTAADAVLFRYTSSATPTDLSADSDGDGLPDSVEIAGWRNASSTTYAYRTDSLDPDSDDDGLTDGMEKLYDTDPTDDHSPGIYVEYNDALQTKKYYSWQPYGSRYVALNTVVARRGATFAVGGPADAEIEIGKSLTSLTTLIVERDACDGRWYVSIPAGGTVGIYTITVREGAWTKSLNLYVIFELPTDRSAAFIDAFIYDDDPASTRDQTSLGYYENTKNEYDHDDYSWIPEDEWITHGYVWRFNTQHYTQLILEGHVMEAINGRTTTWSASDALGDHVDSVTCFGNPRPLGTSWCVLYPDRCGPMYSNENQCTNIANLLTAFNRAAGIPARLVFVDWTHGTFDHSTEVWTRPSGGTQGWYVTRGYRYNENSGGACQEYDPPAPGAGYEYPAFYDQGHNPLRTTSGWYNTGQGVYAANENWPWVGTSDSNYPGADEFRLASWDLNKTTRTGNIVRRDWFESRFGAYWYWPAEPVVTGSPPNDWPALPPAPVVNFSGAPTVGVLPLLVTFDGQYTNHVRTQLWAFGDGGSSTASDPTHTYSSPGTYTVTLTAQGAGGVTTETKQNYIRICSPVAAAFDAAPTSGNAPLTVVLTNTSTGNPASCSWTFGDGNTSNLCNPSSHTYTAAGTYTMRLTVVNCAGGSSSATTNVTVLSTLLAAAAATPVATAMPFTALSADSATPHHPSWNFGDDDSQVQNSNLVIPSANTDAHSARHFVYFPAVFKNSAANSGSGLAIQWGPVVAEYGVDLDGDARFDQLVLEIEVNVTQPGVYWLRGALGGFVETTLQTHLEGGTQIIPLAFNGMDIYMHKADGPYRLTGLWITDVEMPAPEDLADNALAYADPDYQTSPYQFSDFGVASATLSEKYSYRTVDTNADEYMDALVLELNLKVEKSGAYTVQGVVLGEQEGMLSEATQAISSAIATLPISLQFNGLRDSVGPYTLYIHVRDAEGQVTDGLKEPYVIETIPAFTARPIQLGVETPRTSLPGEIQPAFAITDTGYTDRGVDTDGDGQFDQLLITVNVAVEPDEGGAAYRLEGWLVDEHDAPIAWTIVAPEILAEGIHSLSLAFDGRIINEHGVDGPYKLVALKALAGETYTVLNKVDVAYTTSTYDDDDFEAVASAPAVTLFADNMESETGLIAAETFEAGALGADWTTWSSTVEGRIQITGTYGVARGAQALLMDDVVDGGYTLNEAIWTVNLSGTTGVTLTFWYAEFGDEHHTFGADFTGHFNADGIAISADGVRWHPIFDAPAQGSGVWQQYSIDLAAEAAEAGMSLGPDFQIKFQQYDNYPLVTGPDGLGWDEIVLLTDKSKEPWAAEAPWTLQNDRWHSYTQAWSAEALNQRGSLSVLAQDMAQYVNPTLVFKTCYSMQSDDNVGRVEVSSDGVGWSEVATYTNATPHWSTIQVGLDTLNETPEAQFRFTLDAEDTSSEALWVVDDVWVTGWPAVTAASFDYANKPVMQGEVITFVAVYTSVDTTLPLTYTWNFDDGSILVTNAPTATHQFANPVQHTVWLTVENPYDNAAFSLPIAVRQAVTETAFTFGPGNLTNDWEISFTSTYLPLSATTPVTYTWNFGNGDALVITTTATLTHEFASDDASYTVWLTTTNDYGDAVTASHVVTVPLDEDGDGILNSLEVGADPSHPVDTDSDGVPDYLDEDSDDDGVLDAVEAGDIPRAPMDTDGDTLPDYQDTDDDGDGVDTLAEDVNGNGDPTDDDTDADNTPNYLDADDDGDGINTLDEDADGDGDPTNDDADLDGIPNYLDEDSDGDGIPDSDEGAGDPDTDGLPNYLDEDSDGDDILDSTEGVDDPDTDGIPNYLDEDSDGDDIPDSVEGVGDPDTDGIPNYLDEDSDGDGIPDSAEGVGDPDTDDIPNYLDEDSDGDGKLDVDEGTGDIDGDGIPNWLDADENYPPVAVDDAAVTDEDVPVAVDVTSNDTDLDGNPLVVSGVGAIAHGTAIYAGPVLTYTPAADFFGMDTFTYTVSDGALTDSAWITVTVNSVQDAPVVSDIPDQTIAEGAPFTTINLDTYVSDADNADDQLTWTYSGNVLLTVSLVERVATITAPDAEWSGSETLVFTATDPGGLTDSDTAVFTVTAVNDAPVVSDIPDQTIAEGATFTAISLDAYVSDVDNPDDQLTWTYSGNTALTVNIVNRVATITAPDANWNGSETLVFTATDPGGLRDNTAAAFTVTPVNDAPIVADIPDQSVNQGETFATIALDTYVSDVDHTDAQMTWTYSGNTALSVSIVNRVATITAPSPNWTGWETLIFTATDPGGLSASDLATFAVGAVEIPPVVGNIPDQTIAEGATFTTIALDDYVSDANNTDAELTWTYSGNVALTVSLVERVATITTPGVDWSGSETLVFTATDPDGLSDSDSAAFTVTPVNDAPVVGDIPDQQVTEGGTFVAIQLDNYVTDVDNADTEMTWTYSGNISLTVSIANRIATITIPDANWNGSEILTFTAADPGGLSDSDAVTFTVTAVNDAPVVTAIPDQLIAEGETFAAINLDDYVSDVDNTDAEMTWTYGGNISLTVYITDRVATIVAPSLTWTGWETLIFTATDPGGLNDHDAVVFAIGDVEIPPTVDDIPDQTIAAGEPFAAIALDDYVSDPNNADAELTWTHSGNISLTVTIVDRVATITPPSANWIGAETLIFTATDPGGLSDSDAATFIVTAVNAGPVVGDIPNQTIAAGESFVTIALDDYVSDPDNADAELTWTYSGNISLTVTIEDRVATITPPSANWIGAETVIFTATDPGGLSDSDAATFIVTAANAAPVVGDIPDQTLTAGEPFAAIALDDYVSDSNNADAELVWTYSGNISLTVTIVDRVATITTPSANWIGAETVVFTATDPGGLRDSDAAVFTLQNHSIYLPLLLKHKQ